MNIIVSFFGLFGPFLVWPVELLFPYPFIVEELYKLAVVKYAHGDSDNTKQAFKDGLRTVILAGVLFAFSETVFYSININVAGISSLLFLRLFLTTVLHTITFAIIYIFQKGKTRTIVSFLTAVLIHYLYNRYIRIYF